MSFTACGVSWTEGVLTALPHDQHGQNARSDGEIERYKEQTCPKRIFALQYAILCDGEHDGRKCAGNAGSNDPCCKDLRYAAPAPNNAISTESSDPDSYDTSYYTVPAGGQSGGLVRDTGMRILTLSRLEGQSWSPTSSRWKNPPRHIPCPASARLVPVEKQKH